MKALRWLCLIVLLEMSAFVIPYPVQSQPAPPTNLAAVFVSEDEVRLSWNAPAGDTPLSYWLFRDGYQTHIVYATQIVITLPEPGTFVFTVKAFYHNGVSNPSNPVTVTWYGANNSSLYETFDIGLPVSWSTEPEGVTNTWTWENGPHGGLTTPHMRITSGFNGFQNLQNLITPRMDFSEASHVQLSYLHSMQDSFWGNDVGRVQFSFDRIAWLTIAEYTNQEFDARSVVLDVSNQVAGHADVWFRFQFETNSFFGYDWRLDNVSVFADVGGEPGPVTLNLVPAQTEITAEGGVVYYDAHLISELGQTIQGLMYRTYVTLPDSQTVGPLSQSEVTLTPFMDTWALALGLVVPENAVPGTYQFTGRLSYNQNQYLQDSFPFTVAAGVGTSRQGTNSNPTDWETVGSWPRGLTTAAGWESLPHQAVLSPAWPDPFNAETRVTLTLPRSADHLRVRLFNVAGREVQLLAEGPFAAGRHEITVNASALASGVYFVRAEGSVIPPLTTKLILIR